MGGLDFYLMLMIKPAGHLLQNGVLYIQLEITIYTFMTIPITEGHLN